MCFYTSCNLKHFSPEITASQPGAVVLPGDIWQFLELFLIVTSGEGVLLKSSAETPGMLLTLLQCTGQPSKNYSS